MCAHLGRGRLGHPCRAGRTAPPDDPQDRVEDWQAGLVRRTLQRLWQTFVSPWAPCGALCYDARPSSRARPALRGGGGELGLCGRCGARSMINLRPCCGAAKNGYAYCELNLRGPAAAAALDAVASIPGVILPGRCIAQLQQRTRAKQVGAGGSGSACGRSAATRSVCEHERR